MAYYKRSLQIFLVLPVLAAVYFMVPNTAQQVATPESAYAQQTLRQTVTWRNCEPISVVLGKKNMNLEKNRLVRESLKFVADATNLRFVIVGTTDEIPQIDWSIVGSKAPGAQYPPVYIGWLDDEETDILADRSTLGAAVANPITVNSGRQLVSGAVVFNNSLYQSVGSSKTSGETKRNLIIHELGHLVGLDHVTSPSIMHSNPDKWPSTPTLDDLKTFGKLPTNC